MSVHNLLRISEAASLAMHTMALLAANRGRLLSTRRIARRLRASQAHLSKVLQRLTRAGLVEPVRGPKGGFRLSDDPDTITLLQVYEAIEGPLEPTDCLLDIRLCKGNGRRCLLGNLLQVVNRRVRERLAQTRLSEIAGALTNGGDHA